MKALFAGIPAAQRYYLCLLIALQVLLAVVVLAGTFKVVGDTREEALDFHLYNASQRVRVLEDHVSQSFNVLNLMLGSVPELLPGPRLDAKKKGDQLNNILRQVSFVRSLSLADQHGTILASSSLENVGKKVDFSDFLPVIEGPNDGVMRFGVPREGKDFFDGRVTSPTSPVGERQSYFWPAIRYLPEARGMVAVVAINPDYFMNHMTKYVDSGLGVVGLFNYQGIAALTSFENRTAGSFLVDQKILGLVLDHELGEIANNEVAGTPVLTAYRALAKYPFFVVTHVNREAALARWREATASRLLIVGTALSITLLITGLLTMRMRRHFVAEAQALEAQRLAASVFAHSHAGIMVTDAKGLIQAINPAFSQMTGYVEADVLGKGARVLKSGLTPPETYASMWSALSLGQFWDGEFINRRKDGSTYPEQATIAPIRDDAGQTRHYVAIKRDISEQKELEHKLRLAKEHAESANLAKSRFLATMSHEIRTPLNGVLGMAQLLIAGTSSEKETKDYANTILHSGQTLLSLLNDILDLSKIEAGHLTLSTCEVRPVDLVRRVTNLFAENLANKGLTLSMGNMDFPHAAYHADGLRLEQMLSNLLSNAIKFTHQGTIHIEAKSLSEDEQGALLEFAVEDTGIGIDEAQRNRLFKPFSQVDDSTTRQFGGTGLGLSIVRSLALMMGGDVGVESAPGQGSRFWFRVRLAPALPEKSEMTPSPSSPMSTAELLPPVSPRLRGRVLVVEDNRVNRVVVENMLRKLALEVWHAEDGAQAVERVKADADQIDLVLMDVQMPVLDGLEATAQIRAWEKAFDRRPLLIVALTADAFAEDRERCMAAGMDDFLTKPVSMRELSATLSKWIPSCVNSV